LKITILTIFGSVVLAGLPVCAHHSFAGFDMEKTVTLTGTVKEFQWVNPHAWIQIMVADAGGKSIEWSVEMSAPSGLLRRGWKPKTLMPGDRLVIVVHPLRDGQAGGSFVSGKLADGKVLGGSPTGDPALSPTSEVK
jgi:Family of unknown function (DUF6152)